MAGFFCAVYQASGMLHEICEICRGFHYPSGPVRSLCPAPYTRQRRIRETLRPIPPSHPGRSPCRPSVRRRHSAARLQLSGKTAFFPQNDRPYGLKRNAFQTKIALSTSRAAIASPLNRRRREKIFPNCLSLSTDKGVGCGHSRRLCGFRLSEGI